MDLLHDRFDPRARQLVVSYEPENSQIFVDEERLAVLGLTLHDLAAFLESQPYIFAAFTSEDVSHTRLSSAPNRFGQRRIMFALDRTSG